jgi:hypothetical protein
MAKIELARDVPSSSVSTLAIPAPGFHSSGGGRLPCGSRPCLRRISTNGIGQVMVDKYMSSPSRRHVTIKAICSMC